MIEFGKRLPNSIKGREHFLLFCRRLFCHVNVNNYWHSCVRFFYYHSGGNMVEFVREYLVYWWQYLPYHVAIMAVGFIVFYFIIQGGNDETSI